MTRDEPTKYRQFLDAVARALTEEDDIWQFRTLAGGTTLVARAEDDEEVVALIDAGSLDAMVTVDDIVRVAALAARVGTTACESRPAAFVCSRRAPSGDAVQAAYLRNLRILNVHPTGEDSWGYDVAILSHQEFTQPPNAPTLSEQQWRAVHDGSNDAVFNDAQQAPIATFAGLRAELAWHEQSEVAWGSSQFDLPAGTLMTVPDQPPLPVTGVTLRFHKETRPLRAAGEESAFADLASNWLWG